MKYIFMDNYRGFSQTFIPLSQVAFLVGENSTGKSSFLSLLNLFSNMSFWFMPNFSLRDSSDLGGFKDIVSATSPSKEHFTVGLLSSQSKKEKTPAGTESCSFVFLTFRDNEGVPQLTRYVEYRDNRLLKILFLHKFTRYKLLDLDVVINDKKASSDLFLKILSDDISDRKGFKALPKALGPHPPIPVIKALIHPADKQKLMDLATWGSEVPWAVSFTWLAPIRTKPRRTYDGFVTDFTPEGAHTPHVIRKTLASREKAKKFVELLKNFGDSSGLFKDVDAHSYGRDPAAPFEVLIQLADQPLNISNVGYGVSQVLPVVVEMLTRSKGHWFAIQQPEVHLHPKAQAALGDLMHFLVKERNHHYVVETHSDYLIDRFRLRIRETSASHGAQVVFFERTAVGQNKAHILPINQKGQYPQDQPPGFRDFFIKEQIQLLEI